VMGAVYADNFTSIGQLDVYVIYGIVIFCVATWLMDKWIGRSKQ